MKISHRSQIADESGANDPAEFIPFAKPCLGEEEAAAAAEVVRSGWLTTGPNAREFERQFGAFLGVEFAIAVNSATAGLHLGLEALGVGNGDIVITTPFTFTATAEVIRYLGADPVFCDIDPATLNLDPNYLEVLLKRHPAKAIIPMHYGGQSCDMDPIIALARKHGCKILSDAAHAFPSKYKGTFVGALDDDISVFSFYANKTICTGEGGMAVTGNRALADRMKVMRLHGIDRDAFDRHRSETPAWYYEVIAPGFKYNMPDIAAAIGLKQLAKAENFRLAREHIARRYDNLLTNSALTGPKKVRVSDQHSWHLYPVRLKLDQLSIDRNAFIEELSINGIGTSVHYIPLHLHPYWRDRYSLRRQDFPISSMVYEEIVSLPIYPGLTDHQVERVSTTVNEILARNER